ncbi:MAG: lipase family alpha/beta hydrolase [Solirubrobacteraceae bacterium]|nr:MAG: lipase [Solirubrobacterales bacterium]
MPRLSSSLVALLGCCLVLGVTTPLASAQMSLANPPPGANDFSCRPSAAHPDPVVLVHGLGATMGENWGYLSPLLAARGYCVFALTYGSDPRFPFAGGVIPIQQSAPELGAFVDRVLAATKAAKVDLVGHSEGTFMPEYWLKYLGGASKVNRYIAMTPLYQGTNLLGLAMLRDFGQSLGVSPLLLNLVGGFCGSCSQFLAGSEMVKALNQGGPAVAGVQYTTIPTRYDELVVPYTSGILNAPNATNHILQDVCPNDFSEHVAEAFDPVVAQIVFNALDPAHARAVSCAGLPPLLAPAPTGGAGASAPSRTGGAGHRGARRHRSQRRRHSHRRSTRSTRARRVARAG